MYTTSTRWWDRTGDEAAREAWAACHAISQGSIARDERNMRTLRAYGARHQIGASAVDYVYEPAKVMLGLNVVRSICDSIHADMVQSRPRPSVLTGGASSAERWRMQQQARRMSWAFEGFFDQCRVYDATSASTLDSLVCDAGCLLVHRPHPRLPGIAVERLYPWDVHVDPREAMHGEPRTVYVRRWMDREEMRDRYPDAGSALDGGDRAAATLDGGYGGASSDSVLVLEAWHVGVGGKPGVHLLATSAGLVMHEDWSGPIPVVVQRFAKLPVGFWGDSPANMLIGIQYEINVLLRSIQEAHRLLGKAMVIWPESSGAVVSHWDNRIGSILKVKSLREGAPQIVAPQVVPPEIYRQLDRLYQYAYEIIGASQLGAQARKPAGLDSGRALLVYEDATSRRFLPASRAYEAVHMDVARHIARVASAIDREHPVEVTWSGRSVRSALRSMRWRDVAIDDDAYSLRVFPATALSRDLPGRMAQVEGLVNAGLIDREQAMRLLDLPDIDQHLQRMQASWDVVEADLDAIYESSEDEYEPRVPEPYYDLALTVRLVQASLLQARVSEAPEWVLQRVRTYLEFAKRLLREAQQGAEVTSGQEQ